MVVPTDFVALRVFKHSFFVIRICNSSHILFLRKNQFL
ncbi:hypothetical protein LEP1GSC024_1736 [Leptospira noguchii str. 2001034031]|uniref:Uncharacterized protein n=1 Tax=Leptospira noguchii str. 2001034031 TaxID=1193053 RepID=M6Y441_9LEPT|nr:hypothetical protein LEP1GSC024_1736 [Leptospira noguchii str. 2001034031]